MTINLSQVAKSESFDPTEDIESDTTQSAVEEVLRKAKEFSYWWVMAGKTLTIPVDQQMLVRRKIKIEGKLIIIGELCLV
jgi:hypothetical protein